MGSSAIASFAGPTNDGDGCSTGELDADGKYRIRVAGDRVWAFADKNHENWEKIRDHDLVYHFQFNDAQNPTRAQIHPEARKSGLKLTWEWLLDFEMELVPNGSEKYSEKYPGSVVWLRPSSLFGIIKGEYELVQIMNEDGKRLPAWQKFAEYQGSDVA